MNDKEFEQFCVAHGCTQKQIERLKYLRTLPEIQEAMAESEELEDAENVS